MERLIAAKSLQSCPTLCDPMDYSLPGSPVHGILQARILEWVAISFSVKDLLVKHNKSKICDFFFTDNGRIDLPIGKLFLDLEHQVAQRLGKQMR